MQSELYTQEIIGQNKNICFGSVTAINHALWIYLNCAARVRLHCITDDGGVFTNNGSVFLRLEDFR